MNTSTLIARERSDYFCIPEGRHRAVCSAIVSLGHQENFGSVKQKLVMRFEFPDLRVACEENGEKISEPRVKWIFYTVSLHSKANLRQDLERWRGRGFSKEELEGFDVMNVLGQDCHITIIHDHSGDRIRDRITSISKIIGDDENLKPELEIIRYTEVENEQWEILDDWIKEKIRNQVKAEEPVPKVPESIEADDADIPF